MGLLRRSRPLHERLAEAGELDIGSGSRSGLRGVTQVLGPPDFFGNPSPLGEVGFHGVQRPRKWDIVTSAQAELSGQEVHFVALPDGTLIVDEDVPDGALTPLADALEETISPPYRALAIRQGQSIWAVAAKRIEVREIAGHDDEDELELVAWDEVILGRRIDGDLWEVEVSRL